MTDLIESLKDDHARLKRRLDLLGAEIGANPPDPELLYLLAQFFRCFDHLHHEKENALYFALIRHGVPESAFLLRLKSEHATMESHVERLAASLEKLAGRKAKPTQALIGRIRRFIAAQTLHMDDEESQFLPLIAQRLSAERIAEIEAQVEKAGRARGMRRAARRLADIEARLP